MFSPRPRGYYNHGRRDKNGAKDQPASRLNDVDDNANKTAVEYVFGRDTDKCLSHGTVCFFRHRECCGTCRCSLPGLCLSTVYER
ncbi:hypothetical protein CCACVL1_07592 [Corchorus capsularis]|uniref:Uncharacterized protein n=1 Tax=Corchorus capsularis TaxID=210143 RepID=A0A1R3J4S5_COCAP|nr:hypothetical protein CCACVL1_07592 [Corchorus capsularis]